ncbi:S-adenosyl-L-methionine-dependent methyltransferase [Cercophora newfieldiana]|uniref:S-adenosyl-L-methionine-dependent methyltransferase n=1 Tax=Cercophora newfieldiana TaxID=92897 RepID=A0AA39YTA1_9PEZI|nr:S-adenosyl-L-methionine-dependent methyltransferase [Cercophora newfieldiana]
MDIENRRVTDLGFRNSDPNAASMSRQNPVVYKENDRWYGTFRKGKYMFPIDEDELNRMDIFNKFFMVARRDHPFTSPIHNRETPRIMDLGCGTGIWGIEVADRYPNGTHLGVDLNLIQPEFIPPNIQFVQKDIEMTWTDLEPGSWDLIHMRTLNGSIANWPKLYQEVHRHLRPYYGFVEQVEIDWTPRSDDDTLSTNSYLVHWAEELMDAMESFDRPLRMDSNRTKQQMREAGLVDINEEVIKFALNGWPTEPHAKDMGRWFNLGFVQGVSALTLAPLYRSKNIPKEEIAELLQKVVQEAGSLKIHAYFTLHIFTARRPQ